MQRDYGIVRENDEQGMGRMCGEQLPRLECGLLRRCLLDRFYVCMQSLWCNSRNQFGIAGGRTVNVRCFGCDEILGIVRYLHDEAMFVNTDCKCKGEGEDV